jgi:hypothetical protein
MGFSLIECRLGIKQDYQVFAKIRSVLRVIINRPGLKLQGLSLFPVELQQK